MLLAGAVVLLNLLSASDELLDLGVQVRNDHRVLLPLLVVEQDHLRLSRRLLDRALLLG